MEYRLRWPSTECRAFLCRGIANFVEHVGILTRHLSNDDVCQIDLTVDSLQDALAKELLVDSLRIHADAAGRLLDSESV